MKNTLTIFLIIIYSLPSFSQQDSLPVINTAFKPGEYLKYKVNYGIISGGYAEMKVDLEHIGYDWYFHVKAIARTSGIVGALAKVSDRYESYIEIANGLPLQAIRDINENSYLRYNEVIFDRKNGEVISLKSGRHRVPEGTLDVLSAFYFARRSIFRKKLKKGDIIKLTTYFDDELYNVKMKYKETKKVRTKFGRLNCLRFVPVLDDKSPFKKEEDMQVWFSDDGNFIPLKIRLKVGISKVKCDLTDYKDLKNPLGKPFIH